MNIDSISFSFIQLNPYHTKEWHQRLCQVHTSFADTILDPAKLQRNLFQGCSTNYKKIIVKLFSSPIQFWLLLLLAVSNQEFKPLRQPIGEIFAEDISLGVKQCSNRKISLCVKHISSPRFITNLAQMTFADGVISSAHKYEPVLIRVDNDLMFSIYPMSSSVHKNRCRGFLHINIFLIHREFFNHWFSLSLATTSARMR